jgi:ATP-dependent DNA helicase RecG
MGNFSKYLTAEATEYEFKSALEVAKPKSWLKTVSAFANGVGGSIYLGVDDESGKPVGISDMNGTINKISELIKERIEPALTTFVLEPLAVDGTEILRLKVPGGEHTPYFYVGDGTRTAYYRLGNQSVPAPAHILTELTLKGKKQSYDALDYGKKFADYSFTLFDATFRERANSAIDRIKDYASFGIVTGDNLTFAGALFADQYAVYQSRIFCTRWNGLSKTSKFEAKDDAEFEGNIIKILGEALSFIKINSAVKWHKTGNGRVEFRDYPYDAFYESLVNALVHRSYTIIGSEIHIDMYDDRMEIVSPGGMVDGGLIQEIPIEKIASARRNPVLCDIMHRLQYMERRGSGLKKIMDAYPVDIKPEFVSTPQSFIVVLKNLNYGTDENNAQDKAQIKRTDEGIICALIETAVLEHLETHPSATQAATAIAIGKSRRAVQNAMATLKEKGIIERDGSKKTGVWVIKTK